MNFKKTRSDLDQLKNQQQVTISDLFAVFRDLCSDAKDESGIPLSGLSLGDRELLMKNIPWAGRLLLKYYDEENDPVALAKAKADQRQGQILQLNQQCDALQKELTRLNTLAAQENDRRQQAQKLQADIDKTKQESDWLERCDLSQLNLELKAQKEQKARLKTKLAELQAETLQLTEQQPTLLLQISQAQAVRDDASAARDEQAVLLKQARKELTDLQEEKSRDLTRLRDTQAKITAIQAQAKQSGKTIALHEQTLSQEQDKLNNLLEKIRQLEQDTEICRSQETTQQLRLTQLQTKKKQYLSESQKLSISCGQLTEALQKQETQLQKDTQTKQLLESNIEAVSAEIAQIMEQINTLRQNIKDGDQAKIRKNLMEEKRIQEGKLQQLYSVEEELTQLQTKNTALEKRMQDMRSQITHLTENNSSLEQSIASIKQDHETLSLKKQQLERSLTNIRNALEAGNITKTRNTVELMQQILERYKHDCVLLEDLYPGRISLDERYTRDLQDMAERSKRCIALYRNLVEDFTSF